MLLGRLRQGYCPPETSRSGGETGHQDAQEHCKAVGGPVGFH